ncbi:MAG: CotH kinase family protein [Limisphaerales bacterium]
MDTPRLSRNVITILLVAISVRIGVAAVAQTNDPSAAFFDPAVVQNIHLEISPENLDRMRRALPERISVPGTFRWKDQTLHPVGIRYKGNSSSSPDATHKRSFLIEFSEFTKGQRFLGLRHVALDNAVQFGGLYSERLITDILRAAGVVASRCNYARVVLNGKPGGVYVNVERIDRSFLERHFSSSEGALFKVDEGGPGSDLQFLGDNPDVYRTAFELRSKGEKAERDAFEALIEFIRVVNTPVVDGEALARSLDLEAFLKTTAVLLLAGAFDQYTGWGPHNYYLYRNPDDRRWTYIPWDLDVGFADNAFGRVPVLAGWNAAWPAPVPGRPLMERLIADPSLLKRYRTHARALLESSFHPEILIPRLRALHAQIRPALAEDPFPQRRITVPADTSQEGIVSSIERFIRHRYALARAQLDVPGERPTFAPLPREPKSEGPSPGSPSPDAPTGLEAVQVTSTAVHLKWVDRATGEVAHVVQRCSGADCTDFANAIGQGGPNVTTAVDHQVRAGATYRYRVYAVLPTPAGPRGTGTSAPITVSIPAQ